MKLRFVQQFLLCFAILILSSCAKRERFTDQDRLKIKIQLARLADVPMPLGVKPVLDYVGDESFAYTLEDSSLDLASYYCSEMDQYGWNLVGAFQGLEQVLVFEKPHKLVSIVIRKSKDQNFVVIMAINK
jgi:hypothetical protein